MAILFIFLILENILEKFIPFLNFFDEVLTIFSLVLLVIFRNKLVINRNEIIMLVSFMITIIIGIISNLLAGVRVVPIAVIKDIIQISKFFIIYMFGTSYLYKGITRVAFRRISCFSKAYLVILLIFGLASQFIDLGMTGDKRYFIYSYAFLYSHETFLVSAVIIMISVLLAQNDIKNKYYIIAGFCVLLLTMRSKAIIFMLVVISMEILGQRYDFITKGSQFWKKNWAKIILGSVLKLLK
ncbi:hypothetical protein [Lactiplantibacillus plantarum]|uniref:hypothetical protein n=1 Tax=Lactiplantibacillus plantarum TaxID=1590 RepID=UPI0006A5A2FE|nr:hypothetical protein [Lactiplantibacillus plantarum]AXI12232.1 hypothetical protein C6I22_05350 [Lactiplantibacillus plantarum]KOE73424.1 hypothetical protein AB662_02055 [Lactiplantibacillus plantarum]MBW4799189.1 hypothetical protein [Lactiplantibacillus plantarum]MBW4807179.1 hypothetical protein [Lactiplantibacillus plantarum]MCW6121193.1 hypothetical protein [Lactiplantibacillus plantarum]